MVWTIWPFIIHRSWLPHVTPNRFLQRINTIILPHSNYVYETNVKKSNNYEWTGNAMDMYIILPVNFFSIQITHLNLVVIYFVIKRQYELSLVVIQQAVFSGNPYQKPHYDIIRAMALKSGQIMQSILLFSSWIYVCMI